MELSIRWVTVVYYDVLLIPHTFLNTKIFSINKCHVNGYSRAIVNKL